MDWLLFLLSIILLISSFFKFFITKENKTNIDWRFILIILLCFSILGVIVLDILKRFEYSFESIRIVTTFLTLIMAAVSFITTVYFTNRTAKTNKENKNSDFLMTLMKNHYELLNSQHKHIDELLKKLEDQFIGNLYYIDKSIEEFKLWISHSNGLTEKVAALDKIIKSNDYKQNVINDFNKLKKITTKDNHESITRLFISYYLEKDTYKNKFKELSQSHTNKAFSQEFVNLLKTENNFFDLLNEFIDQKEDNIFNSLNYDSICSTCNKLFNEAYKDVGHFFRNSYRVMKLINEFYKKDPIAKNTYQGILRSQYGENIILAIYYNSVFTNNGLGYARELLGSDFFGNENDLKLDEPNHFRKEKLLFSEQDLKLIKKLFLSNALQKDYQDLNNLKKDIKTAFETS